MVWIKSYFQNKEVINKNEKIWLMICLTNDTVWKLVLEFVEQNPEIFNYN